MLETGKQVSQELRQERKRGIAYGYMSVYCRTLSCMHMQEIIESELFIHGKRSHLFFLSSTQKSTLIWCWGLSMNTRDVRWFWKRVNEQESASIYHRCKRYFECPLFARYAHYCSLCFNKTRIQTHLLEMCVANFLPANALAFFRHFFFVLKTNEMWVLLSTNYYVTILNNRPADSFSLLF